MRQLESKTPLIDADGIVYRAGFICKDDEPIGNHIHAVRKTMESILATFPERKGFKAYLTGKFNFRDQLATILPYKGTRPDRKPKYYQEIRQYLVEWFDAEVIDGMEADDAITMAQWAATDKSTCIVTQDKDLKMCPGWHYNWVKKEGFWVSPAEANTMLFKQMLEGDRSDNIPGITGIGPAKVHKILDELGNDPVRWRSRVEQEYKRQYGANWQVAFDEVASLLWMLRTPTTTWKDFV
jgi:5'-3' exonuclease